MTGVQVQLAHTAQHFATIQARHEHVQDDQFRLMRLHLIQGLSPIRSDQYMKTGPFQERSQAFDYGRVIVGQ